MVFVDAHVHIHDCFTLESFLDAAYSNFKVEAFRKGSGNDFTAVLLLAEAANDNWFQRLVSAADGGRSSNNLPCGSWTFHRTNEDVSLIARSGNRMDLFIISGRQVISAEGLEVLALLTSEQFSDGEPINDLIDIVLACDGIPVIPWGFGKWMGKRGRLLKNLIASRKDHQFFLGDNSGRLFLSPEPAHFKVAKKIGIRVLPGSDPLPFASEYQQAGAFGFGFRESLSADQPAAALKCLLRKPDLKMEAYGRLEQPFRFLRNQFAMQIRKWLSKQHRNR